MDIVNVTLRNLTREQKTQVVEIKERDQVVDLLTRMEQALSDKVRSELAEQLVELVQESTKYKEEQVLLESATEYSSVLFSEFRSNGIATYVVEQL